MTFSIALGIVHRNWKNKVYKAGLVFYRKMILVIALWRKKGNEWVVFFYLFKGFF
jgi:hypothetical protein